MRPDRHHVVGIKGTWIGEAQTSNVSLFCRAVDGFRDVDGRTQVARCWPGLGTRLGDTWWRRFVDGAFAASIEDYAQDIAQAIRSGWREGDALTMVGHSRGVRVGCRVLQLLGDLPGVTGGVFVSFDQVTSEGIAYIPDRPIRLPDWMPAALDMIAGDERRLAFPHEPLRGENVFRVLCRGAHADLGGTVSGDRSLADQILLASLGYAGVCGLSWKMEGLRDSASPTGPIHHPLYMTWDPRTWRPGRYFLPGPRRNPKGVNIGGGAWSAVRP